MSKRDTPKVIVKIGPVTVVNLGRDVVHARGAGTTVEVEKIEAEGVGGDVINAKSGRPPDRRRRRPRPDKPAPRPIRRALLQALIGTASIGGMVAASGIAYAFGWG